MSANLDSAWRNTAGQRDWIRVREQIGALMPMPGSPSFDDDDAFLSLQIFPGVWVRDEIWPFPPQWTTNSELVIEDLRAVSYDLDLGSCGSILDYQNRKLLIAVKRFMYLLIFRPNQRPLSLASYRLYRQTLFKIVIWAHTSGEQFGVKAVADLNDYRILATCVCALNKVQRKTLAQIYELLRWWRAKSPSTYNLFVPPPSEDALETFGGFNPLGVRADNESEENRAWRPLPDAFVAANGRICLDYTDKLYPVLLRVLRSLRNIRPVKGVRPRRQVKSVLNQVQWPSLNWEYKKPQNLQDLSFLLSQCQLAVIQLLSLMIGPRWSEVKPMPNGCISLQRARGSTIYVLDARTFKLSVMVEGSEHQWPISGRLGRMLKMQRDSARLVNGTSWRYLWFAATRRLFDGNRPLRQIDALLKRFARRHSLTKKLGGSRYHHHRFRKTVARLVVIALNGGPMILRELFGHATLAMTMTYILSDPELRDDLRRVAEEENRATARAFIDKAAELRGGGASYFNEVLERARSELAVHVPEGRRDQMRFSAQDLIDFMWSEPEGMQIKQVLPGVVGCFKPISEDGACSRAGQTADVAHCSRKCRWHLLLRERGAQLAELSVQDALRNLEGSTSPLARDFWIRIIEDWLVDFPELRGTFGHIPSFAAITGK